MRRSGIATPPVTALPGSARFRRMRIGLLGGSFNPAHTGHRHISVEALNRLGLDEVWWLVSPQNPMKSGRDMASLERRLRHARRVAAHPRIRVMDLEKALGTRYSVDTLGALSSLMPATRLVWLMGADNLLTLHLWRRWEAVFRAVPVAIFDRAPYSIKAAFAKAAQRYRRFRLGEDQASGLADRHPPAWVFVHCPRHPLSATAIRTADAGWLDQEQDADRRRATAR
ncbi:MAG: nicotinate-nucleotide adenylyltransferase [Alphaproteobacteria bacterium]|nr:MAG: nicotinate-nucleotide adenylyltransferase [Alphaproteobacteria bacterium]